MDGERRRVKVIKFKTAVILKDKEMTQKELSEKTGIRIDTISKMCTGKAKHIPVDVLDAICAALDCKPGDLLVYIPDPGV